ncbi:hypothetical protein HGRIS_008032 [Hohenbuehelia grisea]|uniref:Cytochrome P450 n=1 Tax=Hohenbuehelia grisea TaxID=104357 RepID=A0ABR3J6Z0_9AGAR
MVLYPDVLARAQQEIDSVIGKDTLPQFSDRPLLPYLEAVVLESLRWNPVTPLAVPHRNLEEDVYEGYRIPASSTIIANAWAVLHDADNFPEPARFNPGRFYQKAKADMLIDPNDFAFGFGRRVCPGRHLAINSAWISIATILATFSITKAKDAMGREIEPTGEYSSGLVSHPLPFLCDIRPRTDGYRNLIQSLSDAVV